MSVSVVNPGGSSSTSELALNNHVITANFTVPADTTASVTRYLEIAAGITLEIGPNADLEIL